MTNGKLMMMHIIQHRILGFKIAHVYVPGRFSNRLPLKIKLN